MQIKKFNQAFTLVETAIILAIILALTSVFVSSFSKAGGDEALNGAVVTIISVLNDAKSQAVSSKDASDYGVRIYKDKLVQFKNIYGTENKEIGISNLVNISTSTGIGSDVVFSNVSGSTNASGTITVTVSNDQTKTGTIRIYQTGLIEKN